jgi:zinc-finger of transposase IS204/IS1001/IS1096/IS1165
MILISDLPEMVVDQVEVAKTITIRLHAASPTAACPWCSVQAQRVQSRYIRHLADLPVSGRCVRFVLQVRRFFCQNRTCARKIFAERFPSLALPYAQRTIGLQEALRSLGLTAGGEPGAKLGARLGYSGSADTILRLLRQVTMPLARNLASLE